MKFIFFLIAYIIVFLFALIVVLLVAPLSYRAEASTGENASATVVLKWLFGFLRLRYKYVEKRSAAELSVIGIRVREKKTAAREVDVKKENGEAADAFGRGEKETPEAVDGGGEIKGSPKKSDAEKSVTKKSGTKKNITKKSPLKRLMKIQRNIPKKNQKKKKGRGLLAEFRELPHKKELLNNTALLIKRLIKKLKPKHLYLGGEVGFESPDLTGRMFVLLALLQGIARSDIRLTGNFEKKTFDIDIKAKGVLTPAGLIAPVVRYALSRPVRGVILKYLRAA